MTRKALGIAAIAVVILIVICIIIAVVNIKPATFQSSVLYDANINIINEVPSYTRSSGTTGGLFFLTNVIRYEKSIMTTLIILVILFTIVFMSTQRSRG